MGLMKKIVFEHKEVACMIFFVALFFAWNINLPYLGLHEACNLWYGQIAKNYEIKGFIGTRFAPHLFIAPDQIYLNHPIFLSVLVGLVNHMFGYENYVGRIVPITFAILTIVFQYLLVGKVWDRKVAVWASFFLSFFPMFIMFGKLINYEAVVTFFCIFSFYYYYQYVSEFRRQDAFFFYIGLTFAMLTDWPGFIFCGLLFLNSLLIEKNKKIAWGIMGLIAAVLLIQLAYAAYIKGGIEFFLKIFFERTGVSWGETGFPYAGWILVLFLRTIIYFSPLVLFFTVILSAMTVTKKVVFSRAQGTVLWVLFLYATAYAVIFKEGSFVHNFWIYHYVTTFSIVCAIGITGLYKRKSLVSIIAIFFLISSLTVIVTLKNYEKRNEEIYHLLSGIVKEYHLKEQTAVPVMYARDFECMLLPYYFDIKISAVNDMKQLEKIISGGKYLRLLSIRDNFSEVKNIDSMEQFLRERYVFEEISGNRFKIRVFELQQTVSMKTVVQPELHTKNESLNKTNAFVDRWIIPFYKMLITRFNLPEI